MTDVDIPNVTSGLCALLDVAWMARRQASAGEREQAEAFNEACWLLHKMAASARLSPGSPDQTANRVWHDLGERLVETPSFYADGTPVDFEPPPERAEELLGLAPEDRVQQMVEVIHPLAHAYADGRATYAPGMLNDATRVLRAARFDLSATEALGKSVWVTDGMGDSFLSLTMSERAERDSVRDGAGSSSGPF